MKKPALYSIIGILFITSWFIQSGSLFKVDITSGIAINGLSESALRTMFSLVSVAAFFFLIVVSVNYYRLTKFSLNTVRFLYLLYAVFLIVRFIFNLVAMQYRIGFYILSVILIAMSVLPFLYLMQGKITMMVDEAEKARREKKSLR